MGRHDLYTGEVMGGVHLDNPVLQQAMADAGGQITPEDIANLARICAEAVRNRIPLSEVQILDPTLKNCLEEVYEAQAAAQGTSSAQIEREREEQAQADMAAVQGAVAGAAGLGLLAADSIDAILTMSPEAKQESVQAGHACLACGGELGSEEMTMANLMDLTPPSTPAHAMPTRGAGMGMA